MGIYSFARYDPDFFDEARPKDYADLILRRSCKVLAHEIRHMFGLQHCIYYDCLLNGSNNLEGPMRARSTFARSACENCNTTPDSMP